MVGPLPPPDVAPIDDYRAVTLLRILNQYRESPGLKTILTAEDANADDVEQALQEIRDLFYLDTATGVQLDIIGKIFAESRAGQNDDDFRMAIKLRAARKFSGNPDEIINTLKVFFGALFVNYTPFYPAAFMIETDISLTKAQLEALAPAGVGIGILENLEDAVGNGIEDANGTQIQAIGGQ